MKLPCVYIMSNKYHGTLYVGVSSQLIGRVWQHQTGVCDGFTAKYNLNKLMWYEVHASMYEAITREKEIKGGNRKRKIALIESLNPKWEDLYPELVASG